MKWLGILIICLFAGFLFFAEVDMPDYGDPNAPANLHISPEYIERSFEETHTPAFVTAVLADYRGYDTFGETTVIFTAGLVCYLLLGNGAGMIAKYYNLIVCLACRVMAPFILLYGIYIIFFGHYSPGGGFQGGTILAADVIMMRMVLGKKATYKKFPPQLGLILGGIGLLIYGGTGLVAMLAGGNFLDYSFLPIPGVTGPEKRYYGILFVEIGVALGVFGVLLSIFDSLTKEK